MCTKYSELSCPPKRMEFHNLCLAEPDPEEKEKERKMDELAIEYLYRCEVHDRAVCTGPVRHGSILPADGREHQLVQEYALKVKRWLQGQCRAEGIKWSRMMAAIRRTGRLGFKEIKSIRERQVDRSEARGQ